MQGLPGWPDKMVADKMVQAKWYTDEMVLEKLVWTKWYGLNDNYFNRFLIQLNSIYISNQKSKISDRRPEKTQLLTY